MNNSENLTVGVEELRKNQSKYEAGIAKKKFISGILMIITSVFTMISLFILPMYNYNVTSKKAAFIITGKHSIIRIISKYFGGNLGDIAFFNTVTMITGILLIIISVYLTVGSVLSILVKKVCADGVMNKLFNFVTLEIVASIELIILIINMIVARVDVSGSVTNGNAFWILFVGSILMICFNIILSSNDNM